MRKTYNRFLSALLVLAMVISMLPVFVHTAVTAVEGGETEPAEYLANLDFEDGKVAGTVTTGNNPAGTYAAEVVEKDGSKVLHLKSNGTDFLRWYMGIGTVTSTVTMTYDVAVACDPTKSHMFFPTLSNQYIHDPAVQFGTEKNVKLKYKYSVPKSSWGDLEIKEDGSQIAAGSLEWHTVKLIYRPSTSAAAANGSAWLYIDGKLTNAVPYHLNQTNCSNIMIGLNKSGATDNEIYVDNIKVYKSKTPTCYVCTWQDSVCTVCGAKCVEHDYLPATCIAPETCSVCGKTQGGIIDHNYAGANGVCVNGCKKTQEQNEVYNSLIYYDFEDGKVQGVVKNGAPADISVQTFNGNKVLAIKPTTKTVTRWEVPLNGSYSKLTVSYSVAIPKNTTGGQMMFPTITDNTTTLPNVEFGANKGALKYSAKQSQPKNDITSADGASTIGYQEMLWYNVKIVYDYTSGVKVFIDGVETNIEICRAFSTSQKVKNLVTKFYNTAGALYIDDLRVTVEDHTPLAETRPLVNTEHGVSNGDLGFTGDTLDFTMDFEDVEENHYPGTLTLNNVGAELPEYFLGVKEVNGNKVLYMEGKCVGANDHVDWIYALNGNHKKATLSYYVAQITNDPQLIIYPGLANKHHWNPVVKIGVNDNMGGEVMWYRDKVGWVEIMNPDTKVPIRHDLLEWHQFKIVYDLTGEEPVIQVYVDGVLTDAGDALVKTSDDFDRIAVRMCGSNYYDGKIYMDNFKVTVDDHEPMEAPKPLVSDTKAGSLTADRSSMDLTVGGHQYITATVGPADTADKTVTFISSNPSVATVDEWGEVTGVAAGNAIITVTSKSNPALKIQIPVTVTSRKTMKTIYVSVNGGGNGTSANSRCTLQEAMAQVSALHSSMTGDVVVSMAAGYYKLTETLDFDVTHGGTNNHYVTYKAEGDVTIGGKQVITGWTKYKDGIYCAPAAGIQTRQLYVNNIRAVRARSKGSLVNAEFYVNAVGDILGYTSDNVEFTKFAHPEDLEFVYQFLWFNSRNAVSKIELNSTGDKVNITMSQPTWKWQRNSAKEKIESLAYYENALELLDEPGEWYLDTHDGKIYYMPREWENMNTAEISVPVVEELISIEGKDYTDKVQNIVFDGITFADATWNYPTEMGGLAIDQNNHLEENNVLTDKLIDGAVTLIKTNSVNFTGCVFTRLGSIGLKVVDGAQNSMIVGNKFFDISGGAVAIGEPDYFNEEVVNPSDPAKMMKNCDILNNYIHDVAVDYQSSAGLSVGFAANVDISHNEIFDVPYSGMHIGYGWKIRMDTILKNMRITNNFIHDTSWGDVADGGPIYVNGNTAGTKENPNIIANNYIVRSHQAVADIYPDGGAAGWYVTNNFLDEKMHERSWYIVFHPFLHRQERQWAKNNYITYDKDSIDPQPSWAQFEIEPGIVVDPNNLPAEVLAIIAGAGLESAYRHLRGTFAEIVDVNFDNDLEINKVGDTFQVTLTTSNGFGTVTNSNISAYYEIEDTSIATVNDKGLITAKATGITTLKVTVITGDIVKEYTYDVIVGDILNQLVIENSNTLDGGISFYLTTDSFVPVMIGKTILGRTVKVTDFTMSIADTKIASVKGNSIIPKAAGKTTLTITGTYNGVKKTATFSLEIKGETGNQGNGPTLTGMPDIFNKAYENYWLFAKDNEPTGGVQYGDGTIKMEGQYNATFAGSTYLSELLTVGMHIDTATVGTGDWPTIMIRNQDHKKLVTEGTGYLFIFVEKTGIELHRYNNGKRTQIYGDVIGFEQLGGPGILGAYKDNTYYEVQVGAINEANGVRLILRLNGVEIINFLDTSPLAIREEGYFGICGRYEIITLTYIPVDDTSASDCVDANKDHKCDDCGKSVGIHAPIVGGHHCDYCGVKITDCIDEDEDHECDDCEAILSVCADTDSNHKCDICGFRLTWCVDEDKDHICDMCNRKTRCSDKDPKDHKCDTCDRVVSECMDMKGKDHKCDTCGKELSQCADEDNDHLCDLCDAQLTQCVDSDEDGKCDVCGADYTAAKDSSMLIVIVLVLGALATGGAAVIIVLRKKRKK